MEDEPLNALKTARTKYYFEADDRTYQEAANRNSILELETTDQQCRVHQYLLTFPALELYSSKLPPLVRPTTGALFMKVVPNVVDRPKSAAKTEFEGSFHDLTFRVPVKVPGEREDVVNREAGAADVDLLDSLLAGMSTNP
jgi:hypothetical protein